MEAEGTGVQNGGRERFGGQEEQSKDGGRITNSPFRGLVGWVVLVGYTWCKEAEASAVYVKEMP